MSETDRSVPDAETLAAHPELAAIRMHHGPGEPRPQSCRGCMEGHPCGATDLADAYESLLAALAAERERADKAWEAGYGRRQHELRRRVEWHEDMRVLTRRAYLRAYADANAARLAHDRQVAELAWTRRQVGKKQRELNTLRAALAALAAERERADRAERDRDRARNECREVYEERDRARHAAGEWRTQLATTKNVNVVWERSVDDLTTEADTLRAALAVERERAEAAEAVCDELREQQGWVRNNRDRLVEVLNVLAWGGDDSSLGLSVPQWRSVEAVAERIKKAESERDSLREAVDHLARLAGPGGATAEALGIVERLRAAEGGTDGG